MKLAAVLETDISSGGGFNQALNSINMLAELCEDQFDFTVYTNSQENIDYLAQLNLNAKFFKFGMRDAYIKFASTNYLLRSIQSRLSFVGPFEKLLIKDGVDLVYFVTQGMTCLFLQRLNYIATVWDTCHRDWPEFPEVREFNKFLQREQVFRNTLNQAFAVVVDSVSGSKSISIKYGVDEKRIVEIPFSCSPFLKIEATPVEEVLSDFGLEAGYFFYPAQLWPHKNHARILQALTILNKEGIFKTVVFVGGNKGNGSYLQDLVHKLDLSNQVHFLGFVGEDKIKALYEGCCAVVMPTYFGPTNLPPLEAWQMEKPLIYSRHLSEQTKGAAVLADPDCASSLAEAMKEVEHIDCAEKIVKKGIHRLKEIEACKHNAQLELYSKLKTFERRSQCWSQ